jgi:hypothetical protein
MVGIFLAVLAAPGVPASFSVSRETISICHFPTRYQVLVQVLDDQGRPARGARVLFASDDPLQVDFPYPESWTNRDGTAVAVLELRLRSEDAPEVATSIEVTVPPLPSKKIEVKGIDVWRDGAAYFSAPPLAPFTGPYHHVKGRVGGFIGPGVRVNAWSLDPRIAEPLDGITTEETGEFFIEFDVLAHRKGTTVIILAILDGGDYEATIDGHLGVFLRGDPNGTGRIEIADAVAILEGLFLGKELPCADAADADDSGRVGLTDAIFLLCSLFLDGRVIPEPFLDPGPDPTADFLGCEEYAGL